MNSQVRETPWGARESKTHMKAKLRMSRWMDREACAGGDVAFRVVTEYPFTAGGGGVKSWFDDECVRKPTRAQLQKRVGHVIYIFDIAIIENGVVTTAIEIVHAHYTPSYKVEWLNAHGIAVYEAHASTILSVKGFPASFDDILQEVKP